MGLVEYLLIAVGVIAAIFLMVTVVRRISAYYRQRHNMSVWAGVFMLAVAAVIAAFAVYHVERESHQRFRRRRGKVRFRQGIWQIGL